MKFKALFITFNIVLLLSFLTIFFLPFFMLDSGFMMDFWSKNWYFSIIFALILIIVNIVFFSNWKMLSFLEKEDWPGLSGYLEAGVFVKNRFGKRRIGLLCDSLLLLSDFATMAKLETLLRLKKPRLFAAFGVKFAAADLLSGKYEELFSLTVFLRDAKGADTEWLAFYSAFSLHLLKKYSEASQGFITLSGTARDPLVTALSGYMAGVILLRTPDEKEIALKDAGAEAKTRILGKYSRSKWNILIEEAKAGMHIVVLGKLIDETEVWLFDGNLK